MDAAAVDIHLDAVLGAEDDALRAAAERARAAGLPEIAVSPLQGLWLGLLARAIGARRVLELGTLGGYSTICLARGVADGGTVTTVELRDEYAAVAGESIAAAGLSERVAQRVGPALDVLPTLDGPFDLAFLDADKATMDQQLRLTLDRMRPGGVVICDNVVRDGRVADPEQDDASLRGIRAALQILRDDPRIDATALQTVGLKGHDGFAFGVLRS
ncbi:MAG: O-methyltransferase [Solirubrobacteraceae bacterium]|nr:O-methyltransferase [Solirubrobacteraceae bacterium]